MQYCVKFADGTSACLSHYGVKGMRWGVWNEETRARHSQKVRTMKMGSSEYKKHLQATGYSKDQAEKIAKARDWYKKAAIAALTVGAVVGVAALASYAVRHYGVRTLKKGQLLQTVHPGDIGERIAKQSFYASYTKADNAIYAGLFGTRTGTKITKLAAKQDIKIASEARAHKIFAETVKQNPLITWEENGVTNVLHFQEYLRQRGIDPRTASSIKTYRAFNHDLVHKSKPIYNAAHEAFYNRMKQQGYGALTDSYNAFGRHGYSYSPIIVFGEVAFDIASEKPTGSAAKRLQRLAIGKLISGTRPDARTAAKLSAVGASAAAICGIEDNKLIARENFARQYRRDHPNSKKTDAQIKRMYDSSHFLETDPYR